MFNPVIIKGNKQGIRLIIDNAAEIQEVLDCIYYKLSNTKCYYSNIKPICVIFEGKALTDEEKEIVLETLRKIGLNIALPKRDYFENTLNIKNEIPCDNSGLFFVGDIKNGQELKAQTSIVIIGNVETGASVVSTGNIIVIGNLDGYAKAGIEGNPDAFVYAF